MSERTYGPSALTAAQLLERMPDEGMGFGQFGGDDAREICMALPDLVAHIAGLEGAAATAFVDGAKWWHFRETDATMWQSDQQAACEEAARLRLGEYQKWWWTLQQQAARIAELEAGLERIISDGPAVDTGKLIGRLSVQLVSERAKFEARISELEAQLEAERRRADTMGRLADEQCAQLAEARKDTARLDWLETRQSYEWPYLDSAHRDGTLRQEIDEMKGNNE